MAVLMAGTHAHDVIGFIINDTPYYLDLTHSNVKHGDVHALPSIRLSPYTYTNFTLSSPMIGIDEIGLQNDWIENRSFGKQFCDSLLQTMCSDTPPRLTGAPITLQLRNCVHLTIILLAPILAQVNDSSTVFLQLFTFFISPGSSQSCSDGALLQVCPIPFLPYIFPS